MELALLELLLQDGGIFLHGLPPGRVVPGRSTLVVSRLRGRRVRTGFDVYSTGSAIFRQAAVGPGYLLFLEIQLLFIF